LLAYYPFNGNADDLTGWTMSHWGGELNHNGELSGATPAADRVGATNIAYAFDGIDDSGSLPGQENYYGINFGDSADYSICVWVQPAGEQPDTNSLENIILAGNDDDYGDAFHSLCYFRETGRVAAQITSYYDDPVRVESTPCINDGWPHMLVLQKEGTTLRLFVDGAPQGTTNVNSRGGGYGDMARTYRLARTGGWEARKFFAGTLDDIRVYNRAISSSEVLALYHAESDLLRVVSEQGSPLPSCGPHFYAPGTSLVCRVDSPVTNVDDFVYACQGWTLDGHEPGSGTSNSFVVTMTNDAALTWQWVMINGCWLDVSMLGSGSVNLTNGWYVEGSNYTITATPAEGWLFTGWGGDLSGGYTASNAILHMDSDKHVTAVFSDDADGDGLKNTNEWAMGTDPRNPDTDGDGFDDGAEIEHGWEPTRDDSWVLQYILDRKATFGHYDSSFPGSAPRVPAGASLDSPAEPTAAESAMYTLEDLYNRLVSGADGTAVAFTEPLEAPTQRTMHTLNEIMDRMPARHGAALAPADVPRGKWFWCLTDGEWGLREGEKE